jgi:hypothetical protein
MRDGKSDDGDQNVTAGSEKEAAEKLWGRILFKQGPSEHVRAIVQAPGGNGNSTLFYER